MDEHKSLARKNGNKNPIWSWNDSGNKQLDTIMALNIATQNTGMSLVQEFQKHLSNESRRHGIIDNGKHKKGEAKTIRQTESIMCNIIKISSIRT